jgi:DNA-binding response OmpR family regulator
MNVLIADSSPEMRIMLQGASEVIGYGTMIARNGKELFELLPAHHTDIALVVLEWSLPNQQAEETLRRIRSDKRFNKVPVLALIEKKDAVLPAQVYSGGATECLDRETTQEDLVTRMYECVSRAA